MRIRHNLNVVQGIANVLFYMSTREMPEGISLVLIILMNRQFLLETLAVFLNSRDISPVYLLTSTTHEAGKPRKADFKSFEFSKCFGIDM